MNTLKLKIINYDEQTHSLFVSFASDTTQFQDPEKYSPIAFQPSTMWPGVTSQAEIMRLIAQIGLGEVARQEAHEKFLADTTQLNIFKSLIGHSYTFAASDIIETTSNEVVL